MKAERRHELKTNALARGIEGFPNYWRDYGSRALLFVVVMLLVFLLVRYWNQKKQQQAEEVTAAMENVQSELQRLDQFPLSYGGPPSVVLEQRKQILQQADGSIQTLLNSSKDPNILAKANLAQGDLDWKLATLPDMPAAETQPSLRVPNRQKLLNDARAAYERILVPPYDNSALNVYSARMGLAAVAENLQEWDKARQQYEAIVNSSNLPASFRDYARARLDALPGYQRPAYLGPPPPPETQPTTAPAQQLGPQAPSTMPTAPILPTTAPAEATSRPSTMPATMP